MKTRLEGEDMYKILVVDDEDGIRNLIKKYAVFEGHQVIEAVDGMQAIEICKQESFDIIVMDIMMPQLDGFSACREIRKYCQTPVIMLSARGEEYDKIHGFELGIDDYVVKPFSPKELMMRIGAEKVNMSPKEYDLFFYLVKNRGIALTREKLINDVWGYDFYGDDRTLDTHIKLLRRTLGKYSGYIVTLRGVGYRFEA